jgi:hypothetical protein
MGDWCGPLSDTDCIENWGALPNDQRVSENEKGERTKFFFTGNVCAS